jgi:hypothetical protein
MSSAHAIPLPEPAVRAPSTARCDALIELAAVFDPAVNVAVLRRDALAFDVSPQLRGCDLRAAVRADGPDLSLFAGHFDGAAATALVDDLRGLIALFADVTECGQVGVRMVVTRAAMCPRFHVDHVTLRAAVTYLGPGTEWVDHEAVDRRWLGRAAAGASDADSGLLRPGAVIERASTYDVVLLKGTAWPGNEARGAVHRSPAGDGGLRLLVTLDALG